MKTVDVLILENNDGFVKQVQAAFDAKEAYNVCAVSGNGNVGIDYIERLKPQVIVLDLVLSGTDGFGVLQYIKAHQIGITSIVVSNFADDSLVNRAIEMGARYYFVKPVLPEAIVDRVSELLQEKHSEYVVANEVRGKRRVTSLDEKISNIFMTIGIPPHIKGYVFLREGIKLTVETPSIINSITKELYPKIAQKFDTSASKVERAIRHAIEVAWNKGRVEAISSVFGVKVYFGTDRPTNSEFIALVADKLLLDDLR